MKLSITAASDIGRLRHNNEDMVLVGDHFIRDGRHATKADLNSCDRYICAVADGMGGHNGGEVASHDTLHNLQYYISDLPTGLKPHDFNAKIQEWLSSINSILDSKGHADPTLDSMGTTLVAFCYYAQEFYIMNCGDSRLYLYSGKQLQQLTNDHTLNNLYGSKEHSNIITNCIGGGCKSSYIDIVNVTPLIAPGQTILLCSDGLTDMLTDSTIAELLANGANANTLCMAANDAGGYDNISACIIKITVNDKQ